MKQYQVDSLLAQISHYTDRLALPFSDRDCVFTSPSRNALRLDIISNIEYLYDRSFIDSFQKDQLLISLSDAFINGGL